MTRVNTGKTHQTERSVASGEHLVLIDMETLLHHEAHLIDDSPGIQAFETTAEHYLWDSVLRIGLLPRWDFSGDRRIAYDISGLGITDPQEMPFKGPRSTANNTD